MTGCWDFYHSLVSQWRLLTCILHSRPSSQTTILCHCAVIFMNMRFNYMIVCNIAWVTFTISVIDYLIYKQLFIFRRNITHLPKSFSIFLSKIYIHNFQLFARPDCQNHSSIRYILCKWILNSNILLLCKIWNNNMMWC